MEESSGRAHFADFSFEPGSGELRRGGEVSRLQPQPAQVLTLLLRRAGEVVTREQLTQEVWPDTVVEFDQGLNYCIRQIRVALGDSADGPRFIETLARRGYRFAETVTWDTTPPTSAHKTWRAGVAVGVTVAVTIVLILAFGTDRSPSSASALAPIRVAAIPLREGVPGNPLTESLVVELTNAGMGLDVLGPATTLRLVNDDRPHTEIGVELAVDYVISGGIRSVDSGLFVQVIRVRDGAHIFGRVIPRELVRADSTMRLLAGEVGRNLRADPPDQSRDDR